MCLPFVYLLAVSVLSWMRLARRPGAWKDAEILLWVGCAGAHDPRNQKVLRATEGRGPDIVVEASGADRAVGQAFEWVRPGGRVVLYGVSGTGRPNISSDRIVQKDLQVVAGIGSPLLWDRAVQLAAGARPSAEP